MKNFNLLLLAVIILGFTSCIKEPKQFDYDAQYQIEKPIIEAYALENMPGAIFHEETGIWYVILEEGDPDSYEYKLADAAGRLEAPLVHVNYTGTLLDGTQFDKQESETGYQMSLANVIPAWKYMFFPDKIGDEEINGLTIEGLKKGSKVLFVTPSIWGYAQFAQGKIPANSPLVFTIEVLNIKSPYPDTID